MTHPADARVLLTTVIQPVLTYLGQDTPAISSVAAQQLVLGTACAETGLRAFVQRGGGPGRGLFQPEPPTIAWLNQKLTEPRHRAYGLQLSHLYWPTIPMLDQLYCNIAVSVAYCRLRYLVDPQPLGLADDWRDHADTWKRVYNSAAGAGTVQHFLDAVEPIRGLWDEDGRLA